MVPASVFSGGKQLVLRCRTWRTLIWFLLHEQLVCRCMSVHVVSKLAIGSGLEPRNIHRWLRLTASVRLAGTGTGVWNCGFGSDDRLGLSRARPLVMDLVKNTPHLPGTNFPLRTTQASLGYAVQRSHDKRQGRLHVRSMTASSPAGVEPHAQLDLGVHPQHGLIIGAP